MILLALAAAAAQPGELKTFKDWIVGCDNGRACKAVALMPADNLTTATMTVERGPEAEAPLTVTIDVYEGQAETVSVDGRRFPLAEVAHELDGEGYKPERAGAFIAALLGGRSVLLLDKAGKQVTTLSPDGASAALLYMDEKQGRLDTVTALVRKGPKPASAVPAPPALPVIEQPASALPPRGLSAEQAASARGEDSCEDPADEGPPEAFRLDAAHSLVLVPVRCGSGAYNFRSVAMIVNQAGAVSPARFEQPMARDAADADNGVYNAEFTPEDGALQTYNKGRGIGDCGHAQRFAWDGAMFRLVEQTEMDECRGSLDQITTWRAEVRRAETR